MATKTDHEASRMEGVIEDTMSRSPHTEGIIKAFKPLLMVRERLTSELPLQPVDHSRINREKLRKGIPCTGQLPFFLPGDPWDIMGLEVAGAIRQGFPYLAEDAAMFENAIKSGVVLYKAFADFPKSMGEAVAKWSGAMSVKPQAIALLLGTMARVILQAKTNGLGRKIAKMGWEKGYCPVCGAHPTIAVIREKITQKWLHCSRCGHEWRFSRMVCPGCDQESPSGLEYFYVEDRKQETAFTCPHCKRYLITLNHISDLGDYDRDVSAMGLVHLDIIMQQKGYTPMTWCEWNTFFPEGNPNTLC